MALPSPTDAAGSIRRSLTPTAAIFTPKVIKAKREVLDAGFITQTIPNAHCNAGIVGLCTVPEDKAGVDDQGWHIADFLAFRALLCGDNHPRAQTWLAMCDIPALVEANPERYIHSEDRRLVGSAARPAKQQGLGGLLERADNIQVETFPESLKEKFTSALKEKLEIAKTRGYPLFLIVCGIASLEQDMYFGTIGAESRYTLKDLRTELGDDINHVEATVITPAQFSAGWQVNTSFGRQMSTEVLADRDEFLARQLGGVFAQDLSRSFVGWNCPALDEAKVDPSVRMERFPGPACPSDEVKALVAQLQIKIQSCLVGGLSASHMNHSFSFNPKNDEWAELIRGRETPLGYRTLEWYEQRWIRLPTAQTCESTDNGYEFLGNAFGATKRSQLLHIKCLIEESYLAWPDHWASNFGQGLKRDFERFMDKEQPEDLDCHEMFNILEHRSRQSILADGIIQYFDLPMPYNQRARDWDHLKWKGELSEAERSSLIKYFSPVLGCVPGPNVPPGINQNLLSKLQRRLESGANYVRAALGLQFLTSMDSSGLAINRIESFLQKVKVKQAELLASRPDIHLLCSKWLDAIDMPGRDLRNAVGATRMSQAVGAPEDTIDILDFEDEYDIFQSEDIQSEHASNLIGTEDNGDKPVLGPFGEGALSAAVPSSTPNSVANTTSPQRAAGPVPSASASTISSTTNGVAQEDETVNFSREQVNLDAEEARLIKALQTTNNRAEREQLTTELLQLLQGSKDHGDIDAKLNGTVQNSAAEQSNKEPEAFTSFTPVKNGETQLESNGYRTPTHEPQPSTLEPQNTDSTPLPQLWTEYSLKETHKIAPQSPARPVAPVKTHQTSGRKTPPHLRGVGGRRK